MKVPTDIAKAAMKLIANKVIERTRQVWLGTAKQPMTKDHAPVSRRQFVLRGAASASVTAVLASSLLSTAPRVAAQVNKPVPRGITIAQVIDVSPAYQDISKDFLVGSRAAWQDINSKGGIKGRSVNHQTIEINAASADLRMAWEGIKNDPYCVALSGTTADPLASQLDSLLKSSNTAIAHVAPWLQNSSFELSDYTFTAFSSRLDQIVHACKSLSTIGLKSMAVVFATAAEQVQNLRDIQRITNQMGMGIELQAVHADPLLAGQQINSATAPVILFVGGTPELARFTQGLERQSRQRYVIALADVNLQTLQQMGASKSIPVVVTQPVPMVNASMPIVRRYREVLSKLFDEPPTPHSLAGFIAARYTFEVINGIEGPVTRSSVLDAFNRQQEADIGGFRVVRAQQRRISAFVTQSMLTQDGRLLG